MAKYWSASEQGEECLQIAQFTLPQSTILHDLEMFISQIYMLFDALYAPMETSTIIRKKERNTKVNNAGRRRQ